MKDSQQAELVKKILKFHRNYVVKKCNDKSNMTGKEFIEMSLSPVTEALAHVLILTKLNVDAAIVGDLQLMEVVNQLFKNVINMVEAIQQGHSLKNTH